MYLGIDVGGTKTLVASLTDDGVITESTKFPTPKDFDDFIEQLTSVLETFEAKDFRAAGIAIPGRVDRERGVGVAFGNLPWRNAPVQARLERLLHTPVVVDNDANLAALSEAMMLKDTYDVVLYVAIGTGIGIGVISHQKIDETLADIEGGQIILEHEGRHQKWESFASGHAIFEKYGKKAAEINDDETWRAISRDIAVGLIDLISVVQPDVVVFGGGVGAHFGKFHGHLNAELQKYATPLTPIPPILEAQRPEEAAVYGCYDLAKERYAHANTA